ncbi:MAG: DUF2341 domain-containing protein [Fibrobacteria bacterium]|nr:DUF2341 domain-containing protein [Fibrobacteria bacterium]
MYKKPNILQTFPVYLNGYILIVCTLLFLISCSQPTVTSTEIGNPTIAGRLTNSDGTPAVSAKVSLYPENYIPGKENSFPDTWTTIANDNGEYIVKEVIQGNYNIQATDDNNSTMVLIRNIEVPFNDNSPVQAPEASLEKSAQLTLPLSHLSLNNEGYLFFPGLNALALVNDSTLKTGQTTFPAIPSGTYSSLLFYDVTKDTTYLIQDEDIKLSPAQHMIAGDFKLWSHVRKININTTVSGVLIKDSIINFPLLVRLDSMTLDFSTADPDGNDLRFSNSHGKALAYEIEYWNSTNQQAVIWVKTDVISGNNSNQHIFMYTGNASATDQSSGSAVFSNNLGYSGVWHLNETGNTDSLGYEDVTGNQHHGTGIAFNRISRQEALIAGGQQLDSSEIFLGNLSIHNQSVYTISLWVKAPSNQLDGRIFSEAHRESDSALFTLGQKKITESAKLDLYVRENGNLLEVDHITSQHDVFDNNWHYITLVDSLGTYRLFTDGIVSASGQYKKAPKTLESTSFGAIHRDTISHFVSGTYDELRLESTNRSTLWIKLSYENQKPGSKLLVFE